jgi:hypothetical protein
MVRAAGRCSRHCGYARRRPRRGATEQ